MTRKSGTRMIQYAFKYAGSMKSFSKPKTQSRPTALIMQPPMFSCSFSYSWFMAGGNPVLLGLLLRHCWHCPVPPPRPSLFSSGQAAHLITRAGKGEAASFGALRSPPAILKSTQSQRSERDSQKKPFWNVFFWERRGASLSPPHAAPSQILLPAPSLPSAPTATWGKTTQIARLRR